MVKDRGRDIYSYQHRYIDIKINNILCIISVYQETDYILKSV